LNIYLIRHGQTNLNRDGRYQGEVDKEINDYGRFQAELLGQRLKKYNIDIIFSSDLKRVIQTSEIINRYTGTDIIVREGLREINMGEWDTLSMEERLIKHPDYAKQWSMHLKDLPYPGGECGRDVYKRAGRVIDEVVKKGHMNAAIVTSGGTIAILLSKFLGLGQHRRFNLEIDNCSISIIGYDDKTKRMTVKCINDTGHLEGQL
jgi:broad specificity phosphatase PhoE